MRYWPQASITSWSGQTSCDCFSAVVLYVRKGNEGFLLTLNGPKLDALPDHGLAAEMILAQRVMDRF